MSKTTKRKPSESKNGRDSSKGKEATKRPSVFERLGTKATSQSVKRDRSSSPGALSINTGHPQEFCRHWIQNGSCPYGKNCKLSNSHTLISPSKRSSSKREESGSKSSRRSDVTDDKRAVSTLVKRGTPDLNSWDSWDQNNLEYEDEKVLEKRLLLLQRELDLQMKKDARKPEISAKTRSRSSSSSSSSSSDSSSSSASSSGSSAIQRSIKKTRRATPPSPSDDMKKLKSARDSPSRKSSGSGGSKRYLTPPKKMARKKSLSPSRKTVWPQSPGRRVSLTRRKESPSRSRGLSSDRKTKHRSISRTRQRGPSNRRQRTPECKPAYSRQPPRNRSVEKKKDEGKFKDEMRRDRKSEYRDKNMGENSRRVDKARELRLAREKERTEALERCRERQREREAAAKEKERMREDRERERKETAARRDRERKDRRGSRERRRILPPDAEKRHDRSYERYERKDKEKSFERERVRDRALERVMDRKSDERRARSRDSFERPYESRRIMQDSPYRERRFEGEREHISPRDERYRAYPDDRKRERRERVSGSWAEGRYDESKASRSDWVDREFQDASRRDWESREEGSEDWTTYSNSGTREWHARPHSSIPHHEERIRHKSVDKEPIGKEKESGKRISRSGDEGEDTPKRSRTEEAPSSLQEELSDISDDADDILNREDVEFADVDENRLDDGQDQELDDYQLRRSPEHRDSRLTEEEGLDFEEISDEELEEDKSNKAISVGDALGVDWRSLMDECKKQRKKDEGSFSARTFWDTENILGRIGISAKMANSELLTRLKEKYPKLIKDDKKIAILQSMTAEKTPTVSDVVSSTLVHKQAISARADISIRRQLCGLPVVSLETHPNLGLCQWAV